MTQPSIAPYGAWRSPISADLLLTGAVSLSQPSIVAEAGGEAIYWLERRPQEGGRVVIVRWSAGTAQDAIPPGYSAHNRVHEYGGGDYAVHEGVVYFANDEDQRVYRAAPGQPPVPLTPAATPAGALRYADLIVDAARARLICVREDHRPSGREAINTLAAVPLAGGEALILAEGADFYAAPRLSPDSRHLAWLSWNHPNMPWDGTELWLADLAADGSLTGARRVAGGPAESIFQPEWSPDGRLTFISDRSGWWNLYRLGVGGDAPLESLYPLAADFGMAHWVFGLGTYAYESARSLLCAYTDRGQVHLDRLDVDSGRPTPLDLPYQLIFPSYSRLRVAGGTAVFAGASPTQAPAIVRVDLVTGDYTVLRRSTELAVDEGYLSIAQPVEFPTTDGLTAYGYYYPPRNRDFAAPDGELPPLIITTHGGPTSSTNGFLDLENQYWTSRGFALLDVDYGGSTGYGRAYRERLYGQWGVVDVADCVNGARYLAERGLVDGERLIIRGASAAGYTTLCAITFHDVFRAAASHYGISDLEALAQETHKFESRYTDQLVGLYPARRDLYMARSPIHFARHCSAALILFQGLDDEVVPPAQSEAMFRAARDRELPVAYVPFAGERHGFRRAENIKRAIEAELVFYGRVLGFTPAGPLPAVEIENL